MCWPCCKRNLLPVEAPHPRAPSQSSGERMAMLMEREGKIQVIVAEQHLHKKESPQPQLRAPTPSPQQEALPPPAEPMERVVYPSDFARELKEERIVEEKEEWTFLPAERRFHLIDRYYCTNSNLDRRFQVADEFRGLLQQNEVPFLNEASLSLEEFSLVGARTQEDIDFVQDLPSSPSPQPNEALTALDFLRSSSNATP